MAYFEDTGSLIDAPLELVWEYLVSEHHGSAHAGSARNFEVRETVGPTSVISADRLLDGKWVNFITKSTDFPPLCICNEEVEGDFAGSKFILVYRPKGDQTQVDVYGDIRSRAPDPAAGRAKFLKLLEGAYREDVAAIAAFRKKPSSR